MESRAVSCLTTRRAANVSLIACWQRDVLLKSALNGSYGIDRVTNRTRSGNDIGVQPSLFLLTSVTKLSRLYDSKFYIDTRMHQDWPLHDHGTTSLADHTSAFFDHFVR